MGGVKETWLNNIEFDEPLDSQLTNREGYKNERTRKNLQEVGSKMVDSRRDSRIRQDNRLS